MATVTQFWAPHEGQDGLFQAYGTQQWDWAMGDNQFYWKFAVRPQIAVTQVEVIREWTTSDNNLNQVQHFLVTISPFEDPEAPFDVGSFLQFTAIKVQEP